MAIKHFTKIADFTREDYLEVLERAKKFSQGGDFSYLLRGKVLSTLFFSPSSRTLNTFRAAMIKLGGGSIGLEGSHFEAGIEDISDTMSSFFQISDIAVIRYDEADIMEMATKAANIPIINGGGGKEENAAGGLAVAFSLFRNLGRLENIKFGIYGTPKVSRAAKSVIKILSYFNIEIYEDSVLPELGIPEDIKRFAEEKGVAIKQSKLDDFIGDIDVLFVESVPVNLVDKKLVGSYLEKVRTITLDDISKMRKDALVSVVMPRTITKGKLSAEKAIDNDSRSIYFKISEDWMYVNMGLLTKLLKVEV